MTFLHMRFHLNFRASDSGRLIFAFLFSLVLHALLLVFIRFAQPSWKNTANETTTLNVILEKKAAEVVQPAGLPQASQNSKGEAKIGVQAATPVPQSKPASVTLAQNDQPKTETNEDIADKKILAIDKPAKLVVAENATEVQVTKTLAPEPTEEKAKPLAPAPSVDNLVAKVTPPIEEPKKIVSVEPVQEQPAVEKPVTSVTEPVKVEEPKPVKVEEPKPVKIEEPKPAKVEEPKPVKVEEPKPVKVEEPMPIKADEPKPAKIEAPKPVKLEESKPIKPGVADWPEMQPSDGGKSDGDRARPPGYTTPSRSELGFGAFRSLPKISDKKIMFGERRKIVGSKEQELRYVMYRDSVILKLQRIGQLNYPAEAARKNQTGNLTIQFSIRADGSLEEVSIVRPSPYEALNAGAEKIVRMCAPFSPLPDNIRQDTDILTIRVNWTFSNSRQAFD